MLKQLINFYKVSSPRPCNGEALSSSGSQHLHSDARRLKYLKWSTFLSATNPPKESKQNKRMGKTQAQVH